MIAQDNSGGQGEKIGIKLLAAIFATGIMSFGGVVCETALNVAFPTLMREFGVGTSDVQWITTGYLLVLALIVPLSSYLNRRFQLRNLFLTAILLFLSATLLCAVAGDFHMLLVGRLIQGVGTGIALPLMFNIVLEQAPSSKIGLLMGTASLITAMAPALGPVLGGLMIDAYGWRMIFWVLVPLLLLSLLLGVLSIGGGKATTRATFPILDYLLLAVGFVCFIFAVERFSTGGWLSGESLALLASTVAALVAFVLLSKRRAAPLIHLSVFRNRTFLLSLGYILIVQLTVLALGYVIPKYSQLVSGQKATVAGILLLPGTLLGAALAPLSGKLLDMLGAKRPIMTGAAVVMVGLLLFSGFSLQLSTPLFLLFYALFATGQGLSVGNSMTNGLQHLPSARTADGNAVINTLQQLAGAVGTAVAAALVSVAQRNMPGQLSRATLLGSQHAFYLLTGLSLTAFGIVCVIFYRVHTLKGEKDV